jgi:hypothetical protein
MSTLKENIKKLLLNQNLGLPIPMFIGEPGMGKTAFFLTMAEEEGWDVVVVPSQAPPEDFVGIPRLEETRFLYLPSEIIGKMIGCEKRTLFLFDELNMAHPKSMVALYRLFNERYWGNHKISNFSMFAATGNMGEADGTGSVVEEMPSALRERLIILKYEPTLEEFLAYAKRTFGDSIILSFLSAEPQYFCGAELRDNWGAPSPRSWTHLIKMSQLIELDYEFVRGVVGEKAAKAFVTYQEEFAQLTWAKVLEKGLSVVKESNKQYVLASLLERIAGDKEFSEREAKLVIEFCEMLDPDQVGAVIEALSQIGERASVIKEFAGEGSAFRRTLLKMIMS